MKTELGRRLSALEQKAGLAGESIEVTLRTFVSPGANGPVESEPKAILSLSHGWRIERTPGETKHAFVERALREAPRKSGSVTRLVEEVA